MSGVELTTLLPMIAGGLQTGGMLGLSAVGAAKERKHAKHQERRALARSAHETRAARGQPMNLGILEYLMQQFMGAPEGLASTIGQLQASPHRNVRRTGEALAKQPHMRTQQEQELVDLYMSQGLPGLQAMRRTGIPLKDTSRAAPVTTEMLGFDPNAADFGQYTFSGDIVDPNAAAAAHGVGTQNALRAAEASAARYGGLKSFGAESARRQTQLDATAQWQNIANQIAQLNRMGNFQAMGQINPYANLYSGTFAS